MPALPTILAGPQRGIVERPRVQIESGAVPAGLQALAGGLDKAAQTLQVAAERDGHLWATKRAAEIRLGLMKQLESKRDSGEDLTANGGLTAWTETAAQAAFAEAGKTAPNRFGAQYLDAAGIDAMGDLTLSAMRTESEYKTNKTLSDVSATLDVNANILASDPGAFGKIYAQSENLIDTTPMPFEVRIKAKEKLHDLGVSALSGMIDRNPGQALTSLRGGAWDKFLDPGAKIALENSAQSTVDRNEARAEAAAARADRIAVKTMAIHRDETAKEGFDMAETGNITMEWVQEHRGDLDPGDYRTLLASTNQPTTQKKVYNGLLAKAYGGEDIKDDVLGSLGDLSPEDSRYLLTLNKDNFSDDKPKSPVQIGRTLIKNYTDAMGKVLTDGVGQAALAEINAQFELWYRDNPKASQTEIVDESRLLIRRSDTVNYQDLIKKLAKPAYLVGTTDEPKIEETKQATVEAFLARHGGDRAAVQSDPEFQKEMEAIAALEAGYTEHQKAQQSP